MDCLRHKCCSFSAYNLLGTVNCNLFAAQLTTNRSLRCMIPSISFLSIFDFLSAAKFNLQQAFFLLRDATTPNLPSNRRNGK